MFLGGLTMPTTDAFNLASRETSNIPISLLVAIKSLTLFTNALAAVK